MESWEQSQDWESQWWNLCTNTYNEETKQYLYAHYMKIKMVTRYGVTAFDCQGASVIDIGGGPVSMLLKTQTPTQSENNLLFPRMAVRGDAVVVDPCPYPKWVKQRYDEACIELWQMGGEDLDRTTRTFDEAWIYNCLQHTIDPARIIANALRLCRTLRIFEWVDTGVTPGHPHSLTEERLNEWIGAQGKTVQLTGESNCYGKAYYGIFQGLQVSPTRPKSPARQS